MARASFESGATPRSALEQIFKAAIDAVRGASCVQRAITAMPEDLPHPIHLVAIGKAAASMAAGARAALGGRVGAGLLITKTGHLPPGACWPQWCWLEAGHPLPDDGSLAAGRKLLRFVAAGDAPLLFLLSGGTSSLVEVLPPARSLAELVRAHAWLLGCGWPIARVNAVRKGLSAIKGGRLLTHLQGRSAQVLLISDVPGDVIGDVGSGLLIVGDPEPPVAGLPDWLADWYEPPMPAPIGPPVPHRIVARLEDAKNAAAACAATQGWSVRVHEEFLAGDAATAGRRIATQLLAERPALHIWGGETTVLLPEQPGQGGRCQTLALAAAPILAQAPGTALLAAGTDGSDGPTPYAGALVDAGTIARGSAQGIDPVHCLAAADSTRFLAASGDLLRTGPTGTNVMDLVLAVRASG